MSKLEEMGTILMHIALQYTHPDFESMYSDWSTVHDIGEKLVKMSEQPQLNENQQIVLEFLKNKYNGSPMATMFVLHYKLFNGSEIDAVKAYVELSDEEEAQVMQVFIQWVLRQEGGQ